MSIAGFEYKIGDRVVFDAGGIQHTGQVVFVDKVESPYLGLPYLVKFDFLDERVDTGGNVITYQELKKDWEFYCSGSSFPKKLGKGYFCWVSNRHIDCDSLTYNLILINRELNEN